MYIFVKILKVSNKKREIKHKTSKLPEPLKLIHGREARVPWTPDEVPLAQSPSHKRRKGRKPTAGWNHANTNSPCDRSQQTGRFSRNWGFLTWNQARSWRRMGARQSWAMGTGHCIVPLQHANSPPASNSPAEKAPALTSPAWLQQ